MTLKRREFLKSAAGGILLSAAPIRATAKEPLRNPEAIGILYDATLCVGCKACMTACKNANEMPNEFSGDQNLWESPMGLSAKTLTLIRKYSHGDGSVKDREENGYAFFKRQCLHCVKPACVSACPASALQKDPVSGIVTYNKDACIGCRYCQVACPFNVPKFQWHQAFPSIVKCQLCNHRLQEGQIPACCESCPTGASLFGPVETLLAEARRRFTLQPGQFYDFPVSDIGSGEMQMHRAKPYFPKIYGETESGGTQVLYLSGVSFEKLGLPKLPEISYAVLSESIQHMLYNKMIIPAVLLGGLSLLVAGRKNNGDE